jgi:hypothetical protein
MHSFIGDGCESCAQCQSRSPLGSPPESRRFEATPRDNAAPILSASLEARSPVNAAGIIQARELFEYEAERFSSGVDELADKPDGGVREPD